MSMYMFRTSWVRDIPYFRMYRDKNMKIESEDTESEKKKTAFAAHARQ